MYNKEGEVVADNDEYLSPEQNRKEVTDSHESLFSDEIVLSKLLFDYNISLKAQSLKEHVTMLQQAIHLSFRDYRDFLVLKPL